MTVAARGCACYECSMRTTLDVPTVLCSPAWTQKTTGRTWTCVSTGPCRTPALAWALNVWCSLRRALTTSEMSFLSRGTPVMPISDVLQSAQLNARVMFACHH